MLRFRPIAPKPTTCEAVFSSAAVKITGKRPKRKYAKVRGRKNTKTRRYATQNSRAEGKSSPEEIEKMLRLSLERSDSYKSTKYVKVSSRKNTKTRRNSPQNSLTEGKSSPEKMEEMLQLSLERSDGDKSCGNRGDTTAQGSAAGSVIRTRITVESVTDNFEAESGVGFGFSDREKINRQNADTCPGFLSDGRNNVKLRGQKNTKTRHSPPQKSITDGNSSPLEMEAVLQLSLERSDSDKMNLTIDECCKGSDTAAEGSAAGSVITVESVTDTFAAESSVGLGLCFSDWEKINRLSADTCPSFVSDGGNNVIWINEAYRRMVGEGENEIMVRLAVKDEFPDFTPSFACRARLSQRTKEGRIWNRIVACDVWRMMDVAGFAWKLDVKTAIGLGI